MRTIHHAAAALLAALFTQGAWAACYVIYAADGQILYRGQTPPVDLSRNLHETLPLVAPGGRLVFSPGSHGCEHEVNRLSEAAARPAQPGGARGAETIGR